MKGFRATGLSGALTGPPFKLRVDDKPFILSYRFDQRGRAFECAYLFAGSEPPTVRSRKVTSTPSLVNLYL